MSAPGRSAGLGPRRGRGWSRDPRVWLGVAVTVITLWLALRGVSFSELGRDLAQANLLLLIGLSVPAHVLNVYLRALRWRHLTDAVAPMGSGPLFRATAVGFMANNLFPLRAGEFIRAWYLARETGTRSAAILATVVLERLVDALVVILLALAILGAVGTRLGGGASVLLGAPALALLAPVAFIVLLRVAPAKAVALARRVARPVASERFVRGIEEILQTFAEGLGSLRGGLHLFWIALHTVLMWLVVSLVPFLAGILALGIDLGSPTRTLEAAYVTLVAVGFAVAFPSAPGFFGPYHYACRVALSRYGVPEAQALAMGTLVHAVFWVTVVLLGLAVLRLRHTPLEEIEQAAEAETAPPAHPGKDPADERR